MRNSIFVIFIAIFCFVGAKNVATRNDVRVKETHRYEQRMYIGDWGNTQVIELPAQYVFILKHKGKITVMDYCDGDDYAYISGMGKVYLNNHNSISCIEYIKENKSKIINEAFWGKRTKHYLVNDYHQYKLE